jgi:DNA segregation ATPase FtsK/SpoIIIE, S-DNA-T family
VETSPVTGSPETCSECGYSYASLSRPDIPPEIRGYGLRYAALLDGTDDRRLRAHPRPGVWSALEYVCHVRDIYRVQRGRVLEATTEDTPDFASMRRDERVLEDNYNAQDPLVVASEIASASDSLARTLEDLDPAGWDSTGIYHWPTTALRTVDWIGRHTLHESVHHLRDIQGLLDLDSSHIDSHFDSHSDRAKGRQT